MCLQTCDTGDSSVIIINRNAVSVPKWETHAFTFMLEKVRHDAFFFLPKYIK